MHKALQVLQGSYPIAQVREPLSIVQYLSERVNIPHMLSLTHPEGEGKKWSAFDVCEAWAIKRGYTTARTNRPDVYRSANHIMRMTLEGKITLAFSPPDYDKDYWENHPNLVQINELLGLEEAAAKYVADRDDVSDVDELSEDEEGAEEVEEDESEDDDDANTKASTNKFNVLMEQDD
jgi:hypothetical protein